MNPLAGLSVKTEDGVLSSNNFKLMMDRMEGVYGARIESPTYMIQCKMELETKQTRGLKCKLWSHRLSQQRIAVLVEIDSIHACAGQLVPLSWLIW